MPDAVRLCRRDGSASDHRACDLGQAAIGHKLRGPFRSSWRAGKAGDDCTEKEHGEHVQRETERREVRHSVKSRKWQYDIVHDEKTATPNAKPAASHCCL